MAERSLTPLVTDLAAAVGPWNGVATQEITSFDSISVQSNFTDGDTISFSVLGSSPEALEIDELASDVWLMSPILQRFRIISVVQNWAEDGQNIATVTGVSYKKLLTSRHVRTGGLTYTGIDQGTIVWNLIQHAQAAVNGNWGITLGAVTTGVTRDRTYVEGENIGQLAENLQSVINGLWFDVNADRVLSAMLPSAFAQFAQPIVLGVNARKIGRNSSAAGFANVAFVDGGDPTVPVWASTVGLASDLRGRWETTRGFPTTTVQSSLQQAAEGELATSNSPLNAWSVEMEPARWLAESQYLPGDRVILVEPPSVIAGLGNIASRQLMCRVDDVSVSFTADGGLSVSLTAIETAVI